MLLADSVLVQNENGDIFRPSDVGDPIEVVGSWTLEFSNGASITTTNATSFKLARSRDSKDPYLSLDNLLKGSPIEPNKPIVFPERKWKSVVKLSKYTSKESGTFDLSDPAFAKFAGWFCAKVFFSPNREEDYFFRATNIYEQQSYVESLGITETFQKVGSRYAMNKNYLTELLDAFFEFTWCPTIPDDLLFHASAEWFDSLMEGFLSGVSYDASCNAYTVDKRLKPFVTDLVLGYAKTGQFINITHKERDEGTGLELKITFPSKNYDIRILDGYENDTPVVLYDIGKGEFNVSGITVKED